MQKNTNIIAIAYFADCSPNLPFVFSRKQKCEGGGQDCEQKFTNMIAKIEHWGKGNFDPFH